MATGPTKAQTKFYQEAAVLVQILSNTLHNNPASLFAPEPIQPAQVTNGPLRKQPIPEELRRSVSGLRRAPAPSADTDQQ